MAGRRNAQPWLEWATNAHANGMSMRRIAAELRVNVSTISRALRRPTHAAITRTSVGSRKPVTAATPITLEDVRAVVANLDAGGPEAIARELGWQKGRVYRTADAFGELLRRGIVSPTRSLRNLVETMPPRDALEYAVAAYENLTFAANPVIEAFIDKGLTAMEAKLLAALYARPGTALSREYLLDVMSHGYPDADHAPSQKNVDVTVCKVRAKTAAWPIRITTIWGHGYKLVAAPASKEKAHDL